MRQLIELPLALALVLVLTPALSLGVQERPHVVRDQRARCAVAPPHFLALVCALPSLLFLMSRTSLSAS